MRHDPFVIKVQLQQLMNSHPELLEDEGLREDMIEGSTDLYEYLQETENRRQHNETMAAALKLRIDMLAERRKRFEDSDDAMRRRMFKLLQAAQLRKVELLTATLSIRAGVPKVIVTDEDALPETFVRIKREPDKTRIKVALQDGIEVPGATLSNAEESLAILTK